MTYWSESECATHYTTAPHESPTSSNNEQWCSYFIAHVSLLAPTSHFTYQSLGCYNYIALYVGLCKINAIQYNTAIASPICSKCAPCLPCDPMIGNLVHSAFVIIIESDRCSALSSLCIYMACCSNMSERVPIASDNLHYFRDVTSYRTCGLLQSAVYRHIVHVTF